MNCISFIAIFTAIRMKPMEMRIHDARYLVTRISLMARTAATTCSVIDIISATNRIIMGKVSKPF